MFDSAHHALSWAYNIEGRPIVKMSAINHMRQAPPKMAQNMLLLNLTAEDRHGQSAQIIGMVQELPDPAASEYIAAYFGRRLSETDLKIVVFRGCDALGFTLDKRDAVYRIMRSYFGGPMGYREIRRLLGCRDQYALMAKNCLFDTLDIIDHHAMRDITEVLEDHGLIRVTSIPSIPKQTLHTK